MRYSVLFVLALILVSGFIAYFGDILGRRMGKKRLTLFNLRPRYTAIVVTTITGMLISGMALLALISVNTQFRKVLSEGERIFTQNKLLSSRNVTLDRSNRSLLERSRELLERVADRQKKLDVAEKKVAFAERAAKKAEDAVNRLKIEIAARKKDIAARKRDIDLLRGRKLATEDELSRRKDELAHALSKLATIEGDLAGTNARLRVAQAKMEEAEGKLEIADRQLRDVSAMLEHTKIELAANKTDLANETQTRIEADRAKAEFQRQAIGLRSGNLVLRQGDEILRAVISPGQTFDGIRADLVALLEKASLSASDGGRGAGAGKNGRAVSVVFRSPETNVWITDENECLDSAAKAISGSPMDALIQVRCATNTVAGEQAQVELIPYYNKLVYRKGDWIAGGRIDGRDSEGRVLYSLISFLQKEVAESADRLGVVPVANYDPSRNRGVEPQKQLEGLLAVVDQIRSKRAKVEVAVYACADIYAAGPLNMGNLRVSVTKAE